MAVDDSSIVSPRITYRSMILLDTLQPGHDARLTVTEVQPQCGLGDGQSGISGWWESLS
jgi:hypothetical protein